MQVSLFKYCNNNYFEFKTILVILGIFSMPFIIASLGSNLISFYRGMASQIAKQVVTPYSMAFVTVPNDEVAKKIARGVVEKKLAACVNIIPKITSVYEWEGKINEDAELLLMMKTRTSVIADLTAFVRENHPYSVCEVIATSIEQGNQPYFDWIGSVVSEK